MHKQIQTELQVPEQMQEQVLDHKQTQMEMLPQILMML
mgnify:CR=1 FL=1